MTKYEIECLKYFKYQLTLREKMFDQGHTEGYTRTNETVKEYYRQLPHLTEQLKEIETGSIKAFFNLGEKP